LFEAAAELSAGAVLEEEEEDVKRLDSMLENSFTFVLVCPPGVSAPGVAAELIVAEEVEFELRDRVVKRFCSWSVMFPEESCIVISSPFEESGTVEAVVKF